RRGSHIGLLGGRIHRLGGRRGSHVGGGVIHRLVGSHLVVRRGGIHRLVVDELNSGGSLKGFLGGVENQTLRVIGSNGPVDVLVIHGDVLLADAEEPANADDHSGNLTSLADDDIVDFTQLLGVVAGGIVDRETDQLGGKAVGIDKLVALVEKVGVTGSAGFLRVDDAHGHEGDERGGGQQSAHDGILRSFVRNDETGRAVLASQVVRRAAS